MASDKGYASQLSPRGTTTIVQRNLNCRSISGPETATGRCCSHSSTNICSANSTCSADANAEPHRRTCASSHHVRHRCTSSPNRVCGYYTRTHSLYRIATPNDNCSEHPRTYFTTVLSFGHTICDRKLVSPTGAWIFVRGTHDGKCLCAVCRAKPNSSTAVGGAGNAFSRGCGSSDICVCAVGEPAVGVGGPAVGSRFRRVAALRLRVRGSRVD